MNLAQLPTLFIIHLASTLSLTGLIWFVQIVHYPLLKRVGEDTFAGYHGEHVRRTSWVVAAPMIVEAVTAVMISLGPPDFIPAWQAWLGLLLVAVIWVSTLLLQIPAHRRLERVFLTATHRRLVATNWIRTIAWTLRALLLVLWLT
ncbi:MAG: hypothetical protein GTN89_02230 [Acidobacteria bacterium]|nr:hypothetical protein [Acidobacteriota bacterium]NIM61768.1 hypothetical protein [Acidobacteriota bacterium]NIO60012.1 hypothetical protein [Acidobacteriota bacterium]NIQ29204.1 hypothetical protein [Acidobacteriota bacterium]NIQ83778.1 hypothetical protein [Acidobacteriota bacterium]